MTAQAVIAVDKVGNKIRFYDAATLAETRVIDSPEPCVHELAIAPDRRTAYVPLYGDGIYGNNRNPNNKVLVIDLIDRSLADVIDLGPWMAPHGMAATSDGRLWVACDLSNTLLCIDPAGRRIEESYAIPGKGAHMLALTPDEHKVYLSNKEGDLAVFDTRTRRILTTLPMGDPAITAGNGSGSEGLAIAPSGQRMVVADNHRSELHLIDTTSDREIDRVALTMNALSNIKRSRLIRLAFSPDDRWLIVTNYASGLAWMIDARDLRQQTLITVAKGPQGIAFAPDGRTALIANHDSGIITRIDLAARKAIDVIDGGNGIEVLTYY